MSTAKGNPDAVVIGGGIVGCAVTWFLARAGLRVLLVEREGLTAGTSSACMGHLMMYPDPEPMYRMSAHSVRLWKRLLEEEGGFEMRQCGCLWLGESDEDMPLLEDIDRKLRERGDPGELLDAAALRELEPELAPDLVGAFYYPHDAVLFPMQAAGVLLAAARRLGAETRYGCTVRRVIRDASGAVEAVDTDRGRFATRVVINAAGVWAPDVTEMAGAGRVPIFPRRGDLAITMPQDLPIRHQIIEVAYLRTAIGKVADPEDDEPDPGAWAMNVQPQSNGTLLIGSSRQFGGLDRTVNQALLARSLQRAARFVPRILDMQLVRSWAGLRPYTRDKLPVVGPDPTAPGFYIAGGHEGLGITLSMATGEMLAEMLTGAPTTLDPAPFAPERLAEVSRG